MPSSAPRSLWPTLAALVSALICAFWVAIGAAAPECIWRGLQTALPDLSGADLASALLIGLMLAFFVEPAMERLRGLLHRHQEGEAPERRPRKSPLFTASLSLAFALASVSLHDAMTAFVSGRGTEGAAHDSALAAGVALGIAWAIVPFAVTLAWLSARNRWLAVPMGIVGAASPGIAGWLFAWPVPVIVTTAIPTLLILGFGYRQARKPPAQTVFARAARVVALLAGAWLAGAALFDTLLGAGPAARFKLYDAPEFWVDLRFYLGWTLGLLLAPSPYDDAGGAAQPSKACPRPEVAGVR